LPEIRQPSSNPKTAANLHRAKELASRLPDLLVEARTISNTVISGWHGRRRAGPGETFWQFRPFTAGEPAKRVDWRRSARDDHLYVREKEWEAAHTAWLWCDRSRSMDFRSDLASATKLERALVIQLALADLLGRGGERVGIPGLQRPIASRNAAEFLSNAILHAPDEDSFPTVSEIRRFSDVVIIGDFLDPIAGIVGFLDRLGATGAMVHLVQVLDPVEETFPFSGRVEFHDLESGQKLTAGRAESWEEEYREKLAAQRATIASYCQRADWTFLVHHTDRPAGEPLLLLHSRLGGLPTHLSDGGIGQGTLGSEGVQQI
jgi:uncharacterized protein (DUF58 family)